MYCEQCGKQLPGDGELCDACAAKGGAAERLAAPSSLATARLLHSRGQSEEAVAACLALLKREPKHADARGLIAQIHAERNQLAEAEYWYRSAVAANPTNTAHRARLAEVRRAREAQDDAATGQNAELSRRRPLAVGILALVGGLAIGGLFCWGRRHRDNNVKRPADRAASVTALSTTAGHTAAETRLIAALRARAKAAGETSLELYDLVVDPSVQTATVTVSVPDSSEGLSLRSAILTRARRVGSWLAQEWPEGRFLTVRVATRKEGELTLLFSGTAARPEAGGDELPALLAQWWGEV